MMNNNNPYNNKNGNDLYEYYKYLLDLKNTIATELYYIKQVLDERTIKHLNEEQINNNIVPEEYFKVRKKEINGRR